MTPLADRAVRLGNPKGQNGCSAPPPAFSTRDSRVLTRTFSRLLTAFVDYVASPKSLIGLRNWAYAPLIMSCDTGLGESCRPTERVAAVCCEVDFADWVLSAKLLIGLGY